MAKVGKIMLRDVPTLKKEAKIEDAARLLIETGEGCVVVVDGKSPIGIISEADFIKNLDSNIKKIKDPVTKIMTSPVVAMSPSMKLDQALKIIDTKRYAKYPVVENNELVGLVTKKDVINSISDNQRLHRNIQNTILVVFVLFEFFIFILFDYISQYL